MGFLSSNWLKRRGKSNGLVFFVKYSVLPFKSSFIPGILSVGKIAAAPNGTLFVAGSLQGFVQVCATWWICYEYLTSQIGETGITAFTEEIFLTKLVEFGI